jgi:signal transduction histidine kinase
MAREVDRLERGVTNLLTAAGLRQGAGMVRPVDGDLAADARQAVDEFAPRFHAAGVDLRLSAPAQCTLRRDPLALRIVLHNLLDNGLKFSSAGGAVEVAVRSEPGACVVEVSDRGAGMNDEERAHAFEPFYRGGSKAHVGGTGLGLHLVKELVELHGGAVAIASEGPGRGARVTVRLPSREGQA